MSFQLSSTLQVPPPPPPPPPASELPPSIDDLLPGMLCFNHIYVSNERPAMLEDRSEDKERNKHSILDGESSSSSSSDFVPFQNVKSILSMENSTASSHKSISCDDSSSKSSMAEDGKKKREVDLHCHEELELADLVPSGNSQSFRHVIIDNRSWPAGIPAEDELRV